MCLSPEWLSVLAFTLTACTTASSAPPTNPKTTLATAFEVPLTDVIEATQFDVNRRVIATVGRFKRGDASVAAAIATNGTKRLLGNATAIRFSGLVDLDASSTLSTGTRHPRGLKTKGMKKPGLMWVVRNEKGVAPGPKDRSRRWTGKRTSETVFIFDLAFREVLRLQINERAPDGFGGFSLGRLVLEQKDGKTTLKTSHQDHLPASRSRCVQPESYERSFELVEGRFRELPNDQPLIPGGCR